MHERVPHLRWGTRYLWVNLESLETAPCRPQAFTTLS